MYLATKYNLITVNNFMEAAGPAAVVDLESRSSNILFTQDVLFLPEYYTYSLRAPIIITKCIKSITGITYLPYAKV